MIIDGTTYADGTPQLVTIALDNARKYRVRVRLFYGDPKTGRDSEQEYDVTGYVSRSTGPVKIPILLASNRSMSGPEIDTAYIVRLLVGGRDVYVHPRYHRPNYRIGNAKIKGLVEVYNGTSLVARFKSTQSAQRWIAFMYGERGTR